MLYVIYLYVFLYECICCIILDKYILYILDNYITNIFIKHMNTYMYICLKSFIIKLWCGMGWQGGLASKSTGCVRLTTRV